MFTVVRSRVQSRKFSILEAEKCTRPRMLQRDKSREGEEKRERARGRAREIERPRETQRERDRQTETKKVAPRQRGAYPTQDAASLSMR